MSRREFTPGETFGHWTVLEELSPRLLVDGKTVRRVAARCLLCGLVFQVQCSSLARGHSQSCGCRRNWHNRITPDADGQFHPPN